MEINTHAPTLGLIFTNLDVQLPAIRHRSANMALNLNNTFLNRQPIKMTINL